MKSDNLLSKRVRSQQSILFFASALMLARFAAGAHAQSASIKGASTVLVAPSEVHNISQHVVKLTDLSAAVHVTQNDAKELAKIGADFSATYSLRNMNLAYKQPDKLRLDGKSPTRGNALMVLNGAMRYVDVPKFKIHMVENLDKSPVRRQSILELGGIVGPDTLKFMSAAFARQDTFDGHLADVYEVTYSGVTNAQHYKVWVDVHSHITLKREWLDSAEKLKATFLYDEPKEAAPGIWLPSRVQVKNADGVLSATITMDDIKVNQGLDDSLFDVPR